MSSKEKRISLGVYPDVSLAQARAARDQCRKQLLPGTDRSVGGCRVSVDYCAEIGRPKIEVMAEHLSLRATAASCRVEPVSGAVYGKKRFARRLTAMCCSRAWIVLGDGTS